MRRGEFRFELLLASPSDKQTVVGRLSVHVAHRIGLYLVPSAGSIAAEFECRQSKSYVHPSVAGLARPAGGLEQGDSMLHAVEIARRFGRGRWGWRGRDDCWRWFRGALGRGRWVGEAGATVGDGSEALWGAGVGVGEGRGDRWRWFRGALGRGRWVGEAGATVGDGSEALWGAGVGVGAACSDGGACLGGGSEPVSPHAGTNATKSRIATAGSTRRVPRFIYTAIPRASITVVCCPIWR